MEIGRERGESGGAHKLLVARGKMNKAWNLDMPSNFQGLHFKYIKDMLQTTLSRFIQMQIQPITSFQSQIYLENFLWEKFQHGQKHNLWT